MQIKIKRFDKSLPLPSYQTAKAAAMDLASRQTVTIEPGSVAQLPLNIALQIPEDYFVLIAARSSLYKRGLSLANGIGIGDADYCGDGDEYRATVYNFTQQPVTINKGERVAQMIILKREVIDLTETEQLAQINRGGFGSTGVS